MMIEDYIESNEGFEEFIYKCPAGKWTIGYGFNVQDMPLPRPVADFWLNYILRTEYIPKLQLLVPKLHLLSANRQIVLIDMIYNLGYSRLSQFKKTLAAINSGDYNTAADEILDSAYARQVPNRANKNAKLMRRG